MGLIIKEDSPLYGAVKSAEEGRRKFKGVWIPSSIWLHPNLSWLEKCLWAEINSLSTNREPCYASNGYIAKMMDSSEKSVSNMVAKLKGMGLIIIVSFDGRNRQMTTLEAPPVGGGRVNSQVDIDTIRGSKVSSSLRSEDTTTELFSPDVDISHLNPQDRSEEREARGAKPQPPIGPAHPPSPVTRTESNIAKARYRLCRMWGRKTSLPWSAKEEAALRKIANTDEEDWLLLEEFYSHAGEEGYYCRKNMITMLNNWAGEIHKAKGGKSVGPKEEEEDLSRFMTGAPKQYRQR